MNPYEILLMLDPELPAEREEELLARVRELVERGGGRWLTHDPWGRRKLAYEIQNRTDGTYHLVTFDASPEALAEITRVLKITDGVLRFMAVRRVEAARTRGRRADREPEYAATNVRSEEEEE